MDPEHPFPDIDARTSAAAKPCVPTDVAVDPDVLLELAGRLQALAAETDAQEPGLRLIGPPTPAALAAVEGPGARTEAALAMERLARVCSDYASSAALRDCGMSIDRELGWLRRETAAIGSGAVRSIRALVDADEASAGGIGGAAGSAGLTRPAA